MARTYLSRQKKTVPEPVTRHGVQRQLAWAAGSEYFQNRDPAWHVAETFQTSFDRLGRQKAGQLEENAAPRTDGSAQSSQPESGQAAASGELASVRRFSETAFQRGNMAGAVLQGTGRMMLTSCLKRTAGQSDRTLQQRTITGLGAKTKNIPGASASQVMFHRGFVNSAVGLVVDVLQDARRTADLMTRLIQGGGGIREHEGMDTLRAMYPFLDSSREEELLAQYRQRLQQADSVQEKALLHSAVIRAETLMDKKAQMKTEFIQKLREISDRAAEALREFQEPDFVDRLMLDLTEEDADASDQPADGGPPDEPDGPPDSPGKKPPGRGRNTGPAGGAGGSEAEPIPPGADPADGQ